MKLAIELDQAIERNYGRVHRAGCRDLRDPEPIGDAETLAEIPALIEAATGWDATTDPAYYIGHRAPCVTVPPAKKD